MINNTDYQETYTTVADQTTWYPISFVYFNDPNTGLPELIVTLDGNTLTYPTDYIVGSQGVQLTTAPAAGLTLKILRNPIFEQLIDFQTGIIDPEQIESGFDRSVMRDLYLHGWLDYLDQYVADTFGQLAPVAWSGDYNDLINTPTIGDGTITLTQNGVVKGSFTMNQSGNATIALDAGITTVDWSDITNKPTFSTVAISGSYNDLLNKPTLATVATTGSYNDLLNKPTLGTMAAENAADYTKTAGLATVATTGDYDDLQNKPTIPTVGNGTITLTQGGVLKGTFTTNQSGNTTIDMDAGGGGSSLPSQTGHSGEFLTTDGTDPAWAVATAVTFRVWGPNE